jgi:SRSO17 transposase
LQQFVTTSTWDTVAVRQRLVRRAVEAVDPQAWVIDHTGFPKDGTGSPCVARQYSGTLGKVANCQIGVSVHGVGDGASHPLDWRLFVPQMSTPVTRLGIRPGSQFLALRPTGPAEPTYGNR